MATRKHGPIRRFASRDELTSASLRELLAPARAYPPSTSVIMLRWCSTCVEWALEGSYDAGYCVTCGSTLLVHEGLRDPRPVERERDSESLTSG